jgi:16S rRNA (cytosine1402-N4)-methyltransferase
MAVTTARHVPVMAGTVLELLRPRAGALIVDATLGLGGHAEALLDAGATVVGLDRDPAALAAATDRLAAHGERFHPVRTGFAELGTVLGGLGVPAADGVLYDLGVSSMQLDEGPRGFSYRHDAPLDMRMDTDGPVTAADVVNTWPVPELIRVLRTYGEERFAPRIARAIEAARAKAPIRTTGELADLVRDAIPAAARRTGPHPARRTFQALRIEVNGELDQITRSLPQAIDLLAPGGRVVVLSYHSLEDRIVKRTFADEAAGSVSPPELPLVVHRAPRLTLLTRRPLLPAADEVAANPRAESAKLRAAEKLPTPSNRSEGR